MIFFCFQIRYPINQRSPRGVNTRYRVNVPGAMLPAGFNQKNPQRFANNKPKKQKPKKDVKKPAKEGEEDESEKKAVVKDDEAEKEQEKTENG